MNHKVRYHTNRINQAQEIDSDLSYGTAITVSFSFTSLRLFIMAHRQHASSTDLERGKLKKRLVTNLVPFIYLQLY